MNLVSLLIHILFWQFAICTSLTAEEIRKKYPPSLAEIKRISVVFFFRGGIAPPPPAPGHYHTSIFIDSKAGRGTGHAFDASDGPTIQQGFKDDRFDNPTRPDGKSRWYMQTKYGVTPIDSGKFASMVVVGTTTKPVSAVEIGNILGQIPVPSRECGQSCNTWLVEALTKLQTKGLLTPFNAAAARQAGYDWSVNRLNEYERLAAQGHNVGDLRRKLIGQYMGEIAGSKVRQLNDEFEIRKPKEWSFRLPKKGLPGKFHILKVTGIGQEVCKRSGAGCSLRSARDFALIAFRGLADQMGLTQTLTKHGMSFDQAHEKLSSKFKLVSLKNLGKSVLHGIGKPSIRGATSAGSALVTAVGLPLYGIALEQTLKSVHATVLDKIAAGTSILPFVGCVVADVNRVDHAYRQPDKEVDVQEVVLTSIESASCYILGAMYFTPLAPLALFIDLARLAVSAMFAWLIPPNPNVDPKIVPDVRFEYWDHMVSEMNKTIFSENYTSGIQAVYHSQVMAAASLTADAAGNYSADLQHLMLNATDQYVKELQEEAEVQGETLRLHFCESVRKIGQDLKNTAVKRLADKVQNATTLFDNHLHEELKLNSKWPWEGYKSEAKKRLEEEERNHPLFERVTTKQLITGFSSHLDTILSLTTDQDSFCAEKADTHEPDLYTLNGECTNPCKSAARRTRTRDWEFGHMSGEGSGIWGCNRFGDAERVAAASPDCCPYAAFEKKGFGIRSADSGDHYLVSSLPLPPPPPLDCARC
ncbi:hypothetical protein XA68_11008 [Ophiocordyceps unilateralis]|uniref:Uncharacterized protein n=1 Tax=Ophiocordyceps unilateralis TaxID=268505 RepID=A0A2A9PHR3_OPHUN|nr:hypothetical protein XA68_11008 [Ophiocordyceps unilateralis]